MEALTSPLLKAPARNDADVPATGAEIATMIDLARNRRAESIVIGSGRSAHAIETARLVEAAWNKVGGQILDVVTWPEAGASWLRHATRFTADNPDPWIMAGATTGWAQMTRRLLWSTRWSPAHTLATAGIGELRLLALVGLSNLDGLAGANADGSSWLVEADLLTNLSAAGSTR